MTTTTTSEFEVGDDLPPSYSSTFEQDVDETSTKESFNDFVISNQPRANSTDSFELSTRSSLQSSKLGTDVHLFSSYDHSSPGGKRLVNNAWNENIVIRNIYQRDQIRLLCFCTSVLGGIASLAFYCTTIYS